MKHAYSEAMMDETMCGIDLRDMRFDPPIPANGDALVNLDEIPSIVLKGGVDALWDLLDTIDCEDCKERMHP